MASSDASPLEKQVEQLAKDVAALVNGMAGMQSLGKGKGPGKGGRIAATYPDRNYKGGKSKGKGAATFAGPKGKGRGGLTYAEVASNWHPCEQCGSYSHRTKDCLYHVVCKACGGHGHYKSDCLHAHKDCHNCGKTGHLARICNSTRISAKADGGDYEDEAAEAAPEDDTSVKRMAAQIKTLQSKLHDHRTKAAKCRETKVESRKEQEKKHRLAELQAKVALDQRKKEIDAEAETVRADCDKRMEEHEAKIPTLEKDLAEMEAKMQKLDAERKEECSKFAKPAGTGKQNNELHAEDDEEEDDEVQELRQKLLRRQQEMQRDQDRLAQLTKPRFRESTALSPFASPGLSKDSGDANATTERSPRNDEDVVRRTKWAKTDGAEIVKADFKFGNKAGGVPGLQHQSVFAQKTVFSNLAADDLTDEEECGTCTAKATCSMCQSRYMADGRACPSDSCGSKGRRRPRSATQCEECGTTFNAPARMED